MGARPLPVGVNAEPAVRTLARQQRPDHRPVEDLVTHRFPFERVRDALRANLFREKSGAIKTVLHP